MIRWLNLAYSQQPKAHITRLLGVVILPNGLGLPDSHLADVCLHALGDYVIFLERPDSVAPEKPISTRVQCDFGVTPAPLRDRNESLCMWG